MHATIHYPELSLYSKLSESEGLVDERPSFRHRRLQVIRKIEVRNPLRIDSSFNGGEPERLHALRGKRRKARPFKIFGRGLLVEFQVLLIGRFSQQSHLSHIRLLGSP